MSFVLGFFYLFRNLCIEIGYTSRHFALYHLSFSLAQIMHAFSVAPFDQNLSIDGKVLTDDSATLGTLGVIPESVILLKVRDGFLPEEFWKVLPSSFLWKVLMMHTHG